jgi:hypothetical protein
VLDVVKTAEILEELPCLNRRTMPSVTPALFCGEDED